jgi:hypothetical protein
LNWHVDAQVRGLRFLKIGIQVWEFWDPFSYENDPSSHDCGYVKMYCVLCYTQEKFDTGQVRHAQYKSIGVCGIGTSSTKTRSILQEQLKV